MAGPASIFGIPRVLTGMYMPWRVLGRVCGARSFGSVGTSVFRGSSCVLSFSA